MTFPLLFCAFFLGLWCIHSSLFFQETWRIEGNFEFSKVLFFLCIWALFSIYFLLKKRFRTNIFILIFIVWVTLSTIFSSFPFLSFFWGTAKWHGLLLFLELFFFSSIFLWLENQERKQIIKYILLGSILLYTIAIYERFFPSHDYGELTKRAIGTFWHPSYLAIYILMTLPFLYEKIFNNKKLKYIPFLFMSIVTLILTQHVFWCFLAVCFTLYFFYEKRLQLLYSIGVPLSIILWWWLLLNTFPEKLHSFISRFYIWESTAYALIASPKILFIWNGPETLNTLFSSFKVPELYIFENFWYSADRAHNIFLDFWFHFWIVSFAISIFCCIFLVKNFEKNPYFEASLIFFIFHFLNFPSVVSYVFFLLCFTKILKDKKLFFEVKTRKYNVMFLPILLWIVFFSVRIFFSESHAYDGEYKKALWYFPNPNYFYKLGNFNDGQNLEGWVSQNYLQKKLYTLKNTREDCENLISSYPSVENYFLCWDILHQVWNQDLAKSYYTLWVAKLPDLWNKDSPYWKNYFVQKTISGNRFFSKKYSNLEEILKILTIENDINIKNIWK